MVTSGLLARLGPVFVTGVAGLAPAIRNRSRADQHRYEQVGWAQVDHDNVRAEMGDLEGQLQPTLLRAALSLAKLPHRVVEARDVLASALERFVRTTEMREIGQAQALSRLAKDRFRSEGG